MIIGTGSCGCALIEGEEYSVGGWGMLLSDQGSAARLGLLAMQRALLAHEGVEPSSPLTRELMQRFDDNPEQVVIWSDSAQPADFGALAPRVFHFAAQHDPQANQLLYCCANELNPLLHTLLHRAEQRQSGLPLALLGGMAEALTPWLDDSLQARLQPAAGDALDGALLFATHHAAGNTGATTTRE